jgi:hypothetical protein
MRRIIALLLLVAVFVMSGCGTVVPPKKYTVIDKMTIDSNFDETWSKTIKWFAINNINIKVLEKDSGIITAESSYLNTDYFDCGIIPYTQLLDVLGRYNVMVEADGNKSNVIFTLNGTGTITKVNGFGDPIGSSYPTACNSIGTLESSFFKSLEK